MQHHTDVLIAGAGLAGSIAASMLARQGLGVVLVDPHTRYPPDLRCEKLIGRQIAILRRTGLAEQVLAAGTLDGECWVAQLGRVIDRRPADQYGILYDTLVNTVRATIRPGTSFVAGKVTKLVNSPQRQVVELSTGQEFSARLVVIANGLNSGLRNALGMAREDLSKCHCVTIAFDLSPAGRRAFDFRALTYFAEPPVRAAYATLFPIGDAMHVNLMVYRDMRDPWIAELRRDPVRAMGAVMPRLGRLIGEADVIGAVRVRPADLYVTRGLLQPGVVLVGDAFATSCPAAGTGADKVFTDVERLCNVHVPQWMRSPGMDAGKIAAFYDDPVKQACDRWSMAKAFSARSLSTGDPLRWRAGRWARFVSGLAKGTARQVLPRPLSGRSADVR